MSTSEAAVKYRRSRFFLVQYQDRKGFDIRAFLGGEIQLTCEPQAAAVSALTELEQPVTAAELALLAQIPDGEWTAGEQLVASLGASPEALAALAHKALLITTSGELRAQHLRQREEAFRANQWHPLAACYNLMLKHPGGLDKTATRDDGIESIDRRSPQRFQDFVAEHGPPPPAFSTPRGTEGMVELPLVKKQGGLYRALDKRRTVRAFDSSRAMAADDVATLLHYVFGCHAYARMSEDVTVVRRTSPSGGSLHPIEAYPLVLNVDGLDTGLYHYNSRDHRLSRMSRMSLESARELAIRCATGQTYAADAHLVLLLTARFYRNYWKYRKSLKTHSIILLDAGHLSQTFYLVCADLGLGASFIAIDGNEIEQTLGIDGIEEGVIGLVTCGVSVSEGSDYGLDFTPYVSRKSAL